MAHPLINKNDITHIGLSMGLIHFITDAVLNYTRGNYEIAVVINNFFNKKWKETQFEKETRLKGEAQSVNEICFMPGTPFAARLSFSTFLKNSTLASNRALL